jgi:hypothetical protein
MITVIEKVLDLTFELRVGTVIVRWMTLEGWLWEYLLEACDNARLPSSMSERKGEEMPTFFANSRKDKSALSRNW